MTMGKKHDELMAEIKLVHQEIFDLRCEIDQIENLLSSVRTIRWKISRILEKKTKELEEPIIKWPFKRKMG